MDYAVDLRRSSPTFGHHVSAELTADNGDQLYMPVGFGHAFVTLQPDTEVSYKVSDYYAPECDGGVHWNCPQIGIDWPLRSEEHTSELQSLMRISYAVFCLKKKQHIQQILQN